MIRFLRDRILPGFKLISVVNRKYRFKTHIPVQDSVWLCQDSVRFPISERSEHN
jgi:hypothetical protein